jgi:hypothetical protein
MTAKNRMINKQFFQNRIDIFLRLIFRRFLDNFRSLLSVGCSNCPCMPPPGSAPENYSSRGVVDLPRV